MAVGRRSSHQHDSGVCGRILRTRGRAERSAGPVYWLENEGANIGQSVVAPCVVRVRVRVCGYPSVSVVASVTKGHGHGDARQDARTPDARRQTPNASSLS